MSLTAHLVPESTTKLEKCTLSCREFPASRTAERIAKHLGKDLKIYGIFDTAMAVTTDTASSIKKAGVSMMPPREWPGCAAHKIELAIKHIMKESPVKQTFTKHNRMATHGHASSPTWQKLAEFQKVVGGAGL